MSRFEPACSRTWAVQPACRDEGEGRREEVRRQPDALEDRGGVVLDVRLEGPLGVELGEHAEGDVLDRDRELQPVRLVLHRLGDPSERLRARVVGPVDPVAEAHQPLAAGDRVADPLLGVLRRADPVDLLDDLRWGAAVERALHRADRAGHRGRDVAPRGRDDPGRERRGVQAVLGADDEVGIEGAGRPGIRTRAGQLVEEARARGRGTGPGRSARGPGAAARTRRAPTARTRSGPEPAPAVGGHSSCWVAPHTETAVRRASIGLAVRGRARRAVMTASGTGAVGRWWRGSHSPVQRRFATAGYVPCSTRSPIR